MCISRPLIPALTPFLPQRDALATMRKAEAEMSGRVEDASRDAREAARGATQAVEAAHTDLQNSIDALERALSAAKDEQQQMVAPLRAEIERVHAVATDATSALSSALQEARREAREAAEAATATAQQEVDSAGRALTTRLAQVQEDTRQDLQDLNEVRTWLRLWRWCRPASSLRSRLCARVGAPLGTGSLTPPDFRPGPPSCSRPSCKRCAPRSPRGERRSASSGRQHRLRRCAAKTMPRWPASCLGW